jgi:hypothetical protein
VEIADLPLEVHAWTGFLYEYTHIADADADAEGEAEDGATLPETLSSLLVSEAWTVPDLVDTP